MFDIKSRWRARVAAACVCGVSLSLAMTSCGEGLEEFEDEYLLDEASLDGTVPEGALVVVTDADAYVQSGGYATRNFGTAKLIDVDQNAKKTEKHGYLHFSVPTGIDIHRARLHLFVRNSSSNSADIFSVPNASWTEKDLTWNNRPTAFGAQVATINGSPRGRWLSVDVTAAVVAGQALTFAVIPRSNDNFAFSSRETSGAPVLVIEEVPAVDPDAGTPEMCDDAGTTEPEDAGTAEPTDAGTQQPADAGTQQPVDAGTQQPVDAGTQQPVDAGTPKPQDAGTPAPVDAGTATPTRFSTDVQPIFNARCVSCHGQNALGGLNLSTNARTALVNVATSCNPSVARVAPGNLMGSSLWLKLADHANKCGGPMPYSPGLKLINPTEFATIEKWISEGALDN